MAAIPNTRTIERRTWAAVSAPAKPMSSVAIAEAMPALPRIMSSITTLRRTGWETTSSDSEVV